MKKVILTTIITVIVVITAGFLINIYTTTYGHFRYKIVNEEIHITKYDGAKENNLQIPSYIKDKPVTTISESVFYGCDNLTGELVIPATITKIESQAFKLCSNLSSIKMLGDAPSIQNDTFDENITVKYKYDVMGYLEDNWKNVYTKPYNIPITVVDVDNVQDIEYNGTNIEPKIVAKFNLEQLVENRDYTLSYMNNIEMGKATIIIYGTGDYIGTREITFNIKAKAIDTLDFSEIKDDTYTGKALTPSVTVKFSNTVLEQDVDYTLEYKNNKNVGTATITITGKGNYTGTKKIKFNIK